MTAYFKYTDAFCTFSGVFIQSWLFICTSFVHTARLLLRIVTSIHIANQLHLVNVLNDIEDVIFFSFFILHL